RPRYMPASCSSRSSNTRAEGMSRLRLASKYDAHRADNGNAFLDGKPAALALINKQTVGMEFLRQLDCLGLAGIHDPGVLPGLGQILYRFDAQPRRKGGMATKQFVPHGLGNSHFAKEFGENVRGADAKQPRPRRRVRDDNHRPASDSTVRRSSDSSSAR